jgi:outer membrane biosynthesis protein TonB
MRSGNKFAALAASLALLTGCAQKPTQAPVPQTAQAPSLPPSRMAALIPPVPPPFPAIARLPVKLDTTAPPEIKPEIATTEPRHSTKRHSKPAQDTAPSDVAKNSASPSAAQPPQVANAQPPEMTRIGQLSAASDNSTTADRHAISTQIDATENGLNSIKRSLSSDEQKTAALIRTYITRARDALKADDLDGANTLSKKAQQLLEELTKQ